jgi:hypothetical protein
LSQNSNEDHNIIDLIEYMNNAPEISHEEYAAWATENVFEKVYFDSGPTAIDHLDEYLELHLYLLSFQFDLKNKAFEGFRKNQSRGVKFAGVTTAFDLAMDKMMTDIEACIETDTFPTGLTKEHIKGADLMPYCISFLTNDHRSIDLRAPVNGDNFDALLLVTPPLMAFFDRYVRKFGVTTFGNLLSYTDGAITLTMKVTPYHRSFGPLADLIDGKVSTMATEDLQPIMPGAHPLMELPFRMEFDTDFYRWQEGREDDQYDDDPDDNDDRDDDAETVVSIH